MKCAKCEEEYKADQMVGDVCCWCERQQVFAAFAKECGLDKYPDPTGERYVYDLDGSCAGKKVEVIEFMDELWNALAAKCGRGDVKIQ